MTASLTAIVLVQHVGWFADAKPPYDLYALRVMSSASYRVYQ